MHQLHGGAVDTSGGSKVDDNVDIGVLGNSLVDLLVDWQQSLTGSPVHLADELTTESIDDTGDGRGGALADEVKVKHALDGTGLHAVDETSCLVGEEGVLRQRGQWPAGLGEAGDVVVGRQPSGRGAIGSGGHCVGGI